MGTQLVFYESKLDKKQNTIILFIFYIILNIWY